MSLKVGSLKILVMRNVALEVIVRLLPICYGNYGLCDNNCQYNEYTEHCYHETTY